MFKFVVICALVASVFAEPEPEAKPGFIAPLAAPLAYASNWLAPSLAYNAGYYRSPYYYSAPLAYSHFIKKRSAEAAPEPEPEAKPEPQPEAKADPGLLSPFYGAYPYSYSYPSAAIATTYSTPYYNAGYWPSLYSAPAAHFIKKRSVGLLPSAYVAPAATVSAPLLSTAYAAAAPAYYPYSAGPLYSSPLAYSHYIKKRSVGFLPAASYVAPAATYATAAAPLFPSTTYAASYYAASPYYNTAPFYPYIKK